MKTAYTPLLAISCWLLTASCADDMTPSTSVEGGKNGQPITFTVDDSQNWYLQQSEANTRGLTPRDFAPKTIEMRSAGGATGLKMTATIANGIDAEPMGADSPFFEEGTRGTTITTKPDIFRVHAYIYDGTVPSWTSWFYDEQATKTGDDWLLTSPRYWPNDISTKLRFYGYTVATGSAASISHSPETDATAPYIDYTVNTSVVSQGDLMTAVTPATRFYADDKVELPFKHALTCVKFVAGTGLANCTINRISLENIVKSGRYDYNGNWTAGTDSANFDMSQLNFAVGASTNVQIVSSTNGATATTMFMVPQQFGSDKQKIEISYNDGSGSKIVEATLNGTAWLPGTTVTYNLSVTTNYEYVLNVTPVTIGHDGGTATFSVSSYRQQSGSTPENLPWHIIGYSDDGINFYADKPVSCSWVGFTDLEGTGSVAITNSKVLVLPQTSLTTSLTSANDDASVMAAHMSTKPQRGTSENPYDLSTHDYSGNETPQNTANCYVINAPGYYKLPLVYGNAIKNSENNSEAYTGENNVQTFSDYAGGYITQPYVWKTATPYKAILVWEDAQNLITTNLNHEIDLCDPDNLTGKYTYMTFRIGNNDIKPGNAILAVVDGSDNIIWSWHIWVTDTQIGATIPITNHQGQIFNLMPVTLGWCSIGTGLEYFDARKMYVKILQDGGKTSVFTITQDNTISYTSELGYAPYYQWGRKDPLQPTMGATNAADRATYGKYPANHNTSSAVSYQQSIRTPNQMFSVSNGNWCNSYRKDLWCAKNGTEGQENNIKILKTIYDPCPVGFHVPETRTFTGITTTGGYVQNNNSALTSTNIKAARNGFEVYTNSEKTATIHFPVLGERVTQPTWYNGPSPATGIVPSYCVDVLYTSSWTAIPASSSQYLYLLLDLWSGYGRFWPTYNSGGNTSSHGHPIRPVADY